MRTKDLPLRVMDRAGGCDFVFSGNSEVFIVTSKTHMSYPQTYSHVTCKKIWGRTHILNRKRLRHNHRFPIVKLKLQYLWSIPTCDFTTGESNLIKKYHLQAPPWRRTPWSGISRYATAPQNHMLNFSLYYSLKLDTEFL